ncbi:MAG: hypothetical protein COZ34_04890 [Candidatus Pacebacteria bacterium CG_4_10_14_3_um_filter_34_15]|nr:hypothetical protein [Candidatus Pacearchaeota archaeon]NCQ65551.1 hypothetical protein [Candidatus Paceibacterota bacterium]OIO44825.1 MAG: hypothetical protein AUJ41_01825 [Candidatus Pacebacteria bacterium CG1_02_43_31]PIQ81295.1 MAG: hypothetical protein COV78_01025 [Candidatus Pacebacteria bacterium CG11_big_fil_rev_8_21_14_0_20_34_55]PIX81122.1 MAG: hypothetical protein COZ34_04890 [Candidatus Pacebacteria bacterium CG_4_10_14_3_um_filter_34_15]PJC43841.1 MAG: hypothetical protein CO0
MLNTEKLLYILPDLTYLAELLPGKKEHTYTIQSFKQINGNFLDDNEFISANIQKLFTKIDKEEYHLILPDFLFTNTIVNVDDESKAGTLAHVRGKLLPASNLSDETHEIELTVLNSFKGKSRVQISAIEKELLAPVRVAADKSKIVIKAVSPLSWAIKSIVSLEPSITVLQIGSNLYSSQHYIGIDQTNNFPVDELSSIVETIKTLKGAEPSIQTIYLASSSLIEEKFKEELGGTLPIQQLATYKEEDSKMPSYVKYIIESCMRTLSIPDYPVPKFKLGKASKEEEAIVDSAQKTEKDDRVTTEKELNSKNTAPTDLPEPSKVPELMVSAKIEDAVMPKTDVTIEEPSKEVVDVKEITDDEKEKSEVKVEAKEEIAKDKDAINLAQFAGKKDDNKDKEAKSETVETKPVTESVTETKSSKKVIKNSSGVNNMLKMVFITLAVFFITIAIGVGVGLGLLKMSDKNSNEEVTPVVITDPEATPEVAATPEPVVEINKAELSLLVVNATSKAGYAGKIKALLIDAEIPGATAGNAEGKYDEGTNYILMTEENPQLVTLLEEATGLDLTYASGVEIEDPDKDYDAVIVLSK